MMRELALVLVLAGCGTHDTAPKRDEAKPAPTEPVRKLDTLHMTVPDGWTSTYDAAGDLWLLTTTPIADGRTANARIERADPSAVASPDAYLHKRRGLWDAGTTAEIETRESVKDGFAMTVVVKPAVDPDHPKRETYVVRELGSAWYQCISEWVPDEAMRGQLLSLCKSIRL